MCHVFFFPPLIFPLCYKRKNLVKVIYSDSSWSIFGSSHNELHFTPLMFTIICCSVGKPFKRWTLGIFFYISFWKLHLTLKMKCAESWLSQPEVKFQHFKVWLPGIRRFHSSGAERQQHTNCLKVSFLLLRLFNRLRVERTWNDF